MPLKKITLIAIILILLPALFYTGYELNSVSAREQIMADIYARQLDAILFSVNQYAWDVVSSWANRLEQVIRDDESNFETFLGSNQAIRALFFADSLLRQVDVVVREDDGALASGLSRQLERRLRKHAPLLRRLRRMKRAGYRKIESLPDSSQGRASQQNLTLLFVPDDLGSGVHVAGFLLDTPRFLVDQLQPKLDELSGEQFILGVFSAGSEQPVFATDLLSSSAVRQKRKLWLFPDYFLGIRLKGETIQELAQKRFRRSLYLMGILDAMLLAGAWVVYRGIRKEMELAQMKSDFVSNVSHQLKTPLALIRMFSESLDMNRVPGESKRREYIKIINKETERLTHLVNNLLNFSRMEAGRKSVHLSRVDLNGVVSEVLRRYAFHFQENGFEVQTELEDGLEEIHAEDEAVAEAFINLIDNAMKYCGTVKSIGVKTGAEDGFVFLEVADRGVGIERSEQQKIFEKFYRGERGNVHNTKGSGLGLTLVKHIMEAHGGFVSVESRPGEGSRFRLHFRKHAGGIASC